MTWRADPKAGDALPDYLDLDTYPKNFDDENHEKKLYTVYCTTEASVTKSL